MYQRYEPPPEAIHLKSQCRWVAAKHSSQPQKHVTSCAPTALLVNLKIQVCSRRQGLSPRREVQLLPASAREFWVRVWRHASDFPSSTGQTSTTCSLVYIVFRRCVQISALYSFSDMCCRYISCPSVWSP